MPLSLFPALLELDQKQQKRTIYSHDPALFFTDTLHLTLWPKLTDIITGVEQHNYVAVESGKGVGKSVTVAGLVCWWLMRYPVATVITLSPSWANVLNVIWRYIQRMHQDAGLPGKVLETAKWTFQGQPDRFAIGLSPRHDKPEDVAAFQSYHSPNLLVIIDEAPGFGRLVFDAALGMAVSENNRIVAIGNPIAQDAFASLCLNPSWHHIQISSLDHPNILTGETLVPGAITRKWVEDRIHDHCVRMPEAGSEGFEYPPGSGQFWLPDAYFESFVLGRVPKESTDQLIPLSWVTNAQSWRAEGKGELVLGLDPSRVAHGDAAAMVARRGAEVLWVKRRRPRTNDPGGELAGWLGEERRALGASRCFVDETGIGASVVDAGRVAGIPIIGILFGAGAMERNRYANRRTECWLKMRDALQGGALSLPDDDLLTGDLTAPKFWYDRTGRYMLEPKEDIKGRLGRSPDSADALACTFALPETGLINQDQRRELSDGLKPVSAEKVSRWAGTALLQGQGRGSRWRR